MFLLPHFENQTVSPYVQLHKAAFKFNITAKANAVVLLCTSSNAAMNTDIVGSECTLSSLTATQTIIIGVLAANCTTARENENAAGMTMNGLQFELRSASCLLFTDTQTQTGITLH
jgi:hypothetical protein